jgi:hypothetical protein
VQGMHPLVFLAFNVVFIFFVQNVLLCSLSSSPPRRGARTGLFVLLAVDSSKRFRVISGRFSSTRRMIEFRASLTRRLVDRGCRWWLRSSLCSHGDGCEDRRDIIKIYLIL